MGTTRFKPCKHFNGMANKICKAGVYYDDVVEKSRIPCLHHDMECDQRRLPTDAELDAQEKEDLRQEMCLSKNLSFCCEAPIDESRVIQEGRQMGHGPRFCTKCKKLAFWV